MDPNTQRKEKAAILSKCRQESRCEASETHLRHLDLMEQKDQDALTLEKVRAILSCRGKPHRFLPSYNYVCCELCFGEEASVYIEKNCKTQPTVFSVVAAVRMFDSKDIATCST